MGVLKVAGDAASEKPMSPQMRPRSMRRCMRAATPIVAAVAVVLLVTPATADLMDARTQDPGGCAVPSADPAATPTASYSCDGIRPGARMTSPSGCTMNFVFTDGTELYIGTAGHCVNGVGDNVRVAGEGSIGRVVVQELDWALVEVYDDKRHRVDPSVCYWGGPTGLVTGDPGPGVPLKQYGHGVVIGWTAVSRPRGGVATHWSEYSVKFNGPQVFGDSGSPVITADGLAAGSTSAITPPVNGGIISAQRISKGLEVSEEALGKDLELVTAPLASVP